MEEKILNFVKENWGITKTHATNLRQINDLQAKRLLQKLAAKYEKF